MKKCLKIAFSVPPSKEFLQTTVLQNARDLEIEGTAQVALPENIIRIIACGSKQAIDSFLDIIHKEIVKLHINDIEVEPFLKEKDYRGVFRILE